jgi:uncharacterized protein
MADDREGTLFKGAGGGADPSLKPVDAYARGTDPLPSAVALSDQAPSNASATPAASTFQQDLDRSDRLRIQIEGEFKEVQRAVIFYAALLLPLLALSGFAFHSGDKDVVALECVTGGILYCVIAIFAWCWRHELRGLFRRPHVDSRWIWAVVALAPLLTIASASVMVLGARKLGWPTQEVAPPLVAAGWPTGLILLWIAVLPAVFEEIALRGLILGKLGRVMSRTHAAWVSSILFGLLHFDLVGMAVFIVAMGWIAAWLTYRTRSLWPAMIIHFLHNAGIVMLELSF